VVSAVVALNPQRGGCDEGCCKRGSCHGGFRVRKACWDNVSYWSRSLNVNLRTYVEFNMTLVSAVAFRDTSGESMYANSALQ
jgi:hypothetical protein